MINLFLTFLRWWMRPRRKEMLIPNSQDKVIKASDLYRSTRK